MSENSTRYADASWPHPGSEAARIEGRYVPAPRTDSADRADRADGCADATATMRDQLRD